MAKRSRSTGIGPTDRRLVAEFGGTLALVLVGCGSVAINGLGGNSAAGILQIGVAFGLTLTAVAYWIGAISGAHINPAVTVAMWAAGRMRGDEVMPYIIAQVIGAIVGAGILVLILWAKLGAVDLQGLRLGQNLMGPGFSYGSVVLVEFFATLLFTLVILGATRDGSPIAGVIIGFTLIALHLAFFNADGLSVNPARSIGPAVWVRGDALFQIWLYIVVPLIGGAVAGWLSRRRTFG